MALSPASLLSYVALTKSVEEIKTGIPDVLPAPFWDIKEQVPGDAAEYVVYKGSRRTARQTPAGAPPRTADKQDIGTQKIKLISSETEMPFVDELLNVFRQWERYEPQQKWAMDQVAYYAKQHRQEQDNLRMAVVTGVLANGITWFDSNGNLLPTSSGATLTIDQGIPTSTNTGTCNSIFNASWATTTTDIVSQVNNLKAAALKISGYPLRKAFYGANVAGYIASNATCQAFLSRNNWSPTAFNNQIAMTGQIPNGFLDLEWYPVQNAFFEDSSAVNQTIFPADQITFTPDINAATYCLFEGSRLIPSSYGPMPSGEAALASLVEVYGIYRYATVSMKPVAIYDVIGDTFLPRLRTPKAFFLADTVP